MQDEPSGLVGRPEPCGTAAHYRDALAIACQRLRETHLKLGLLLVTCPSGARASQVLCQYGYLDRDFEISLATVPPGEFSALATIARGLQELEAVRRAGG